MQYFLILWFPIFWYLLILVISEDVAQGRGAPKRGAGEGSCKTPSGPEPWYANGQGCVMSILPFIFQISFFPQENRWFVCNNEFNPISTSKSKLTCFRRMSNISMQQVRFCGFIWSSFSFFSLSPLGELESLLVGSIKRQKIRKQSNFYLIL